MLAAFMSKMTYALMHEITNSDDNNEIWVQIFSEIIFC